MALVTAVELQLGPVLLSILNGCQLLLLVYLQREQKRVKKELADHNGEVLDQLYQISRNTTTA